MTAAAAFLIFFIVVAVLISLLIAIGRFASSDGMSRDKRRELKEARALIKEIEKTARQYRTLDNNFAEVIIDMIDQSEMKELQ
jgi:hypothetical protein